MNESTDKNDADWLIIRYMTQILITCIVFIASVNEVHRLLVKSQTKSYILQYFSQQFGTVVSAVGREADVSQLHGFNSRSQ